MRHNRGRGNNSIARNAYDSGPLMAEHMRNLDMELELLKCKREMIEQQQQLLNKQISYDERQYSSQVFGSNSRNQSMSNSQRNFAYMYDQPAGTAHSPLYGGGRKRPSEPVWIENSPPKRFSGSKKSTVNKAYSPHQGYGASSSSTSSGQRYLESQNLMSMHTKSYVNAKANPMPKIALKNAFKPKSQTTPPNNLATYPMLERANLIAQTVHSINKAMVLRPDVEPSPQLNGRLELALGQILKETKAKYGHVQPYSFNYLSQVTIKPMKKMIRERIREVMMGKEVGRLSDIMEHYRKQYPLESDVDIVNAGVELQSIPEIKKLIAKNLRGRPREYFKENISRIVELKLHQMFLKLSQIYGGIVPEDSWVELTPIDKPDLNVENSGNDDGLKIKEEITEDITEEKTEADNKKSTTKLVNLDNLIEKKLPDILKKHIKYITSLLNLNQMCEELVKNYASSNAMTGKKHINEKNAKQSEANQHVEKNTKEQEPIDHIIEKSIKQKETISKNRFYVKILGQEALPKKNAMQSFLSAFRPKSVKKHKSIHNLLFVGVDDKENYEKLLQANGSYVGQYKLEISVSESIKEKKARKNSSVTGDANVIENGKLIEENKTVDEVKIIDDVKTIENVKIIEDAISESDDLQKQIEIVTEEIGQEQVLTDDIDNQITDLLTSIRKAEEDAPNTSIIIEDDNEKLPVTENVVVVIENDPKDVEEHTEDVEEHTEDVEEHTEDVEEHTKEVVEITNEDDINDDPQPSETDKNTETSIPNENEISDNQQPNADVAIEAKDEQVSNAMENVEVITIEESEKPSDAIESKQKTLEPIEESDENAAVVQDVVESVKNETTCKPTPTRSSTRLAAVTPSTIRTRRASRLLSQNQ